MKTPAFQFYPDAWLSSAQIMLMKPEYEGAYIRLLCYAWLDEHCSLPDDDAHLASLSRLNEGWFNGGSQMVRKCFVKHPKLEGRIYNERLFVEREKQALWRAKSQAGGLNSGKSRRCKTKGGSQMVGTKPQPETPQMVEPNGNSLSLFLSLYNITLPDSLNTPGFLSAWKEWETYRKECKKKLTPMAVKKQIQKLELIGPTRAAAAIEYSIRQQYQGIFEENNSRASNKSQFDGMSHASEEAAIAEMLRNS